MSARRPCHTPRRRTVYADDFKNLADRVRRIELLMAFMFGAQLLVVGARAGEFIGWWR